MRPQGWLNFSGASRNQSSFGGPKGSSEKLSYATATEGDEPRMHLWLGDGVLLPGAPRSQLEPTLGLLAMEGEALICSK